MVDCFGSNLNDKEQLNGSIPIDMKFFSYCVEGDDGEKSLSYIKPTAIEHYEMNSEVDERNGQMEFLEDLTLYSFITNKVFIDLDDWDFLEEVRKELINVLGDINVPYKFYNIPLNEEMVKMTNIYFINVKRKEGGVWNRLSGSRKLYSQVSFLFFFFFLFC
jgi:hypothetical protein